MRLYGQGKKHYSKKIWEILNKLKSKKQIELKGMSSKLKKVYLMELSPFSKDLIEAKFKCEYRGQDLPNVKIKVQFIDYKKLNKFLPV